MLPSVLCTSGTSGKCVLQFKGHDLEAKSCFVLLRLGAAEELLKEAKFGSAGGRRSHFRFSVCVPVFVFSFSFKRLFHGSYFYSWNRYIIHPVLREYIPGTSLVLFEAAPCIYQVLIRYVPSSSWECPVCTHGRSLCLVCTMGLYKVLIAYLPGNYSGSTCTESIGAS